MASENSQQRVAWPVAFGLAPLKGSRSLGQVLDFSRENPVNINLSFEQKTSRLEYVQSIYIDNSLNPATITAVMKTTGQSISIPAGWQGYFPVLASVDEPKISFSTTGTPLVPVFFLSFPLPLAIWPASTLANAVTITGNPATDGSTTITAGGTAQNLFAGVTPANGFAVYNPNSSDDLWVSDSTTAAPNGVGSIRVAANGGGYESPNNYKPIGAISVYGPTTGDAVTARRW